MKASDAILNQSRDRKTRLYHYGYLQRHKDTTQSLRDFFDAMDDNYLTDLDLMKTFEGVKI